ncbi:MAG TPA: enoyl-CoA hydratase-related protein [Blastocatellia bacterium]|nr:enoyl-CoA hydratase-related protein [Blastocatellia bacterium]
MTEPQILIRREAPLGWVIVNRPAARNALTTAMWQQLADEIHALVADAEIRVILITGAGDKSFISGADIGDLKAQLAQPALVAESYRFTTTLMQAISDAPKPIIAMINGHCLGGGMLIALACDLRFASATAQFGIPAVKLGVAYPPEHGVARLVQTVGATHAADILLAGRTLDADEAWRIGLLNRVVAAEDLESHTRAYALALAQGAPLSLAAHKVAIQQTMRLARDAAAIEAAVMRCYQSQDCHEGLAAFLAKRQPEFRGE